MFTYRTAGLLAFLSAALHPVALVLGGFATLVGPSIVGGFVWAALGYGLWQGRRGVGYLAFLFSLFGTIAALSGGMGARLAAVQTTWLAIAATDVLIAVTLFVLLWRSRPEINAESPTALRVGIAQTSGRSAHHA